MLHSFHVALFPYCTLFMFCNFHDELLSCCTLFMLHFFLCSTIFMLLFCVALSFYCTLFMLHCHAWIVLEQVLCRELWSDCFFFMCYGKRAIWKFYSSQVAQVVIFFQTHRWSVNVLQTCWNKKRMNAPIEHERCIFIGIKINHKIFSTLSKVSSDLRSQRQ